MTVGRDGARAGGVALSTRLGRARGVHRRGHHVLRARRGLRPPLFGGGGARAHPEERGRAAAARGRVRLKGPQHAFLILFELDDAADGAAAAPAAVRRVRWARVAAAGAHKHFATHYSLKSRNYIGPRSTPSSARWQTSAAAPRPPRARRRCGTAGARAGGPLWRARRRLRPLPRAGFAAPALALGAGRQVEKNAAAQGIGPRLRSTTSRAPVGLVHADAHGGGGGGDFAPAPLFDAILSDPPYGIREKSAALDDAPLTADARRIAGRRPPRAAPRRVSTSSASPCFALAAPRLVVGGRLVFLLPCSPPFPSRSR